jgi:hypothetical protein
MTVALWCGVSVVGAGCGALSDADATGSDSEVATSVVSGALNNESGSAIGYELPRARKGLLERIVDELKPIGTAFAATWMCTGDTLNPAYAGPGNDPYTFTPVNCSVSWGNGLTASSKWSSTFALYYGQSCDNLHARIANQVGGCSVTRTTGVGGNTRTITGPEGRAYAITHDTNGAGTGWDSSVSPAPSDAGVIATCAQGGCSAGRNLVVNGSHLTGSVTSAGGLSRRIWDHTVSTGAGGLTVTGEGPGRTVSGAVTVQHNLARYTATATFNAVGYGEVGCCFPTTGSVTTTFSNGSNMGKTESLSFSAVCGEAILTTAGGQKVPLTLQHCL